MLTILLTTLQIAATVPMISVPMDLDFQVDGRHLPLSACAAGVSETANFVIGGEPFVFAAAAVKAFTPVDFEAAGNVNNPDLMRLAIKATAGCPETPVEAMVLAIDSGTAALPFGLLMAGMSPVVTSSQMTAMRDSGQCDSSLPDFVACGGSVGGGEDQVQVVALIAKRGRARDGGALFAICEIVDERPLCEVQGGRDTLSYKGVLAPGLPTEEAVVAADAAAFDLIRQRP